MKQLKNANYKGHRIKFERFTYDVFGPKQRRGIMAHIYKNKKRIGRASGRTKTSLLRLIKRSIKKRYR